MSNAIRCGKRKQLHPAAPQAKQFAVFLGVHGLHRFLAILVLQQFCLGGVHGVDGSDHMIEYTIGILSNTA